jgi:glutamine amidotransferase
MQALFTLSQEMGSHAGLGVLPGNVVRFPDLAGLKVPHTGWNQLQPVQASPLFAQLSPGDYAYFNHSYYCAAASEDTSATTDYGLTFACMVQRGNLFGVQFHPEKSQRVGQTILKNFIAL